MNRRLQWLAEAAGGTLVGADREFGAVVIDSRALAAGDLFVALRGEHADGHDFVPMAAERGAAGVLVSRTPAVDVPHVLVADPLDALQRAAACWRGQFDLPLVGVGGSNGKTTTKEMVAAILGEVGPTLATRGNLNNHIGVPLTLFRLAAGQRAAVIEMGANHAGEIAALVALARPTVGLITNAGAEHLEGFGSLDGVARAEGELVAGLAPDATAVINADDPYADLWRSMNTAGRLITFGLSPNADWRAVDVFAEIVDGRFVTRFTLRSPAGDVPVALALAGRHNVSNALGAAAAAAATGAPLTAIAAGLARMQPVAGRLQLKRGHRGAWLIDDSYNANPSSVRAGIDVLETLRGEHWLVFGEMGELGEHSVDSHAEIGRYARERGITRLFAMGEGARTTVEAFGAGAAHFADAAALAAAVRAELDERCTVLVKGSRVNRLERVVAALAADAPLQEAG